MDVCICIGSKGLDKRSWQGLEFEGRVGIGCAHICGLIFSASLSQNVFQSK